MPYKGGESGFHNIFVLVPSILFSIMAAPNANASSSISHHHLLKEVPSFTGRLDKEGWLKWKDDFLNIAQMAGWSDTIKYSVAKLRFSGASASRCVKAFEKKQKAKNAFTPYSWDKFSRFAENRVWITAPTNTYLEEWYNFSRQPRMTVAEFADAFEEKLDNLERAAEHNGDDPSDYLPKEKHLVSRFIQGLNNKDIQKTLLRKNPRTFEAALKLASKEEALVTRTERIASSMISRAPAGSDDSVASTSQALAYDSSLQSDRERLSGSGSTLIDVAAPVDTPFL